MKSDSSGRRLDVEEEGFREEEEEEEEEEARWEGFIRYKILKNCQQDNYFLEK